VVYHIWSLQVEAGARWIKSIWQRHPRMLKLAYVDKHACFPIDWHIISVEMHTKTMTLSQIYQWHTKPTWSDSALNLRICYRGAGSLTISPLHDGCTATYHLGTVKTTGVLGHHCHMTLQCNTTRVNGYHVKCSCQIQ
jgi:hypothetical protein